MRGANPRPLQQDNYIIVNFMKEGEGELRDKIQNELPTMFCQDAEDDIVRLVYDFLDETIDRIIKDWKHLRSVYNMNYEEAVDCMEDYLNSRDYLILNPQKDVKTK